MLSMPDKSADHYSHLSSYSRVGWNKRGGGAKVAKSINVKVEINMGVGFFGKK